jgi:bifunctional NMN adenylyltransferase/nudix hydrolase
MTEQMSLPRTLHTLGVIVGRFQVDSLHEGHYDLISSVQDKHDHLLIVIGLSPCRCTANNPLDFDTRCRMLQDSFPRAITVYITDQYSDELWSSNLDSIIEKSAVVIWKDVTLYGSRDSFIKHYSGKYKTIELPQRSSISGSKIREGLALRSKNTADFRAGAIWAVMNQWESAIPTVDVAIIDTNRNFLLLGKRANEDKYRFPGGFVQSGENYELTAVREIKEEANITVKLEDVQLLRSFFIDDWRYKSEKNKITTILCIATIWEGTITPGDDIDELKWFDLAEIQPDNVVHNHRVVLDFLKQHRDTSMNHT